MMDYLQRVIHRTLNLPKYLSIPLLLGAFLATLLGLFITYLCLLAFKRVVAVRILHIDDYDQLPRPKDTSWIYPLYGHLGTIRAAKPAEAHLEWMKELGTEVYVYRGAVYAPRIMMSDPKAMNYILGQSQCYDFPKPYQTRRFLSELLGEGLLVAEGDVHKRQRKILQPAFNVSGIRNLTPNFFRHGNNFSQVLAKLVDSTEGPSDVPFLPGQSVPSAKESAKGKPVFDIGFWLSKVTLDIIGSAGFDYNFHSVESADGEGDEVSTAFFQMMKSTTRLSTVEILIFVLQSVPGLSWVNKLPTPRRRMILATHAILHRVSERIIESKKEEIKEEFKAQNLSALDKSSFTGDESKAKDLLYLMIKANMATDVKTSEKLDNAELLGQMTTLLLAGHETTSTLLTWLLHFISEPSLIHVQDKLRAEIDDVFAGREELDFDSLMAMPYLDMVIKEILRFNSPVTTTVRTANKDDVIPLSKSYPSRDGKGTFDKVIVRKGQDLMIPVQVINKLESIWGPTANEFDPERWRNIPAAAKASGMPSQMLSFLEGPRGCVGRVFALAESKAILCSLIRTLKFESVGWEVEPKQGIVIQSRIIGQEELGMQMPLRVSRV